MEKYSAEFDPETMQRLTRSFELAWHHLENALANARPEDRDRLAEIIFQLGRDGERNIIKIANLAVDSFRTEIASDRFRAPSVLPQSSNAAFSGIRLQGGA